MLSISLANHSSYGRAAEHSGMNSSATTCDLPGGRKVLAVGSESGCSNFLAPAVNEHSHMYEDVEEYECSVLPDETEHAAGSELVVEVHTDKR